MSLTTVQATGWWTFLFTLGAIIGVSAIIGRRTR